MPRGASGRLTGAALCAAVVLLGLATVASPAEAAPASVSVRTVPPIAGVEIGADGVSARTDANGVASLPITATDGLQERLRAAPTQITPDLTAEFDRVIGSPRRGFTMGLRIRRLVTYRFAGPDKLPIDPQRISGIELRSNTGETVAVKDAEVTAPLWLAASRTQQTTQGLISKDLYWTVSHVTVDGAEVVNKGQQKFVPNQLRDWTVKLLFYQVRVVATDALFGGPAGERLELTRPDASVLTVPLDHGEVHLPNVPRGNYQMKVAGGGLAFVRPVGISKDQVLAVEVVTTLDITLVALGLGSVAAGLVLVGRRRRVAALVSRLRRSGRPPGTRPPARRRMLSRTTVVLLTALVLAAPAGLTAPAAEASPSAGPRPPVLAYYYIWFNPMSWDRAKKDYPMLGRYSSGDPEVMRRHVAMAKSAGLTGFLVSWKHTDVLDPRLDQLVETARAQDFKLGVVYQGLDFQRNPLPAAQVALDLRYFAERYAADPVFGLFRKPVVVITGTERFTADELAGIIGPVRSRLHVLASAKNVEDYRRVAAQVDGDAYYWSSADPGRPAFGQKLAQMGNAVHDRNGLWLAPAPAGFDATDIGGHRIIDRRDSATLRRAMAGAAASAPDAISVISWNEFSENSHIEPSEKHGTAALQALQDFTGTSATPLATGTDSSDGDGRATGLPGWAALAITAAVLLAIPVAVAAVRRRRRPPSPPD
jgi:Glycosyl hydrolase family 99